MHGIETFERQEGGRTFVVRVVEGLSTAGAVWMADEIVVGRGPDEATTEARIAAALQSAARRVEIFASDSTDVEKRSAGSLT